MKYTDTELVKMYKQMVLGRKYEEKMIDLINQGKLEGFWHMAVGEEGVQIGLINALGENDYMSPTFRMHLSLINVMDINKFTAELIGRTTGYNHGLGTTIHISSIEDRILPSNGILGAGIPTAVGYAWALKMDKKDSVVVAVTGDGASNEGNVYEALNLASILDLPFVLLIENNGYAISNPISNASNLTNLSEKSKAFGIPGVTVDGNDILSVREALENAIEMARKGQPNVVEAKTYRIRGHFEGDPGIYRTEEELEEAKKKCPIKRFEKTLLEANLISEPEISKFEKEAIDRIDAAFAYANSCPLPTKEETLDVNKIYANVIGGDLI